MERHVKRYDVKGGITVTEKNEITEVLAKLESEEQLASLQYLVEKLPTFVETLKVAEDKLDFVTSSLQDERSLKMIAADTDRKSVV